MSHTVPWKVSLIVAACANKVSMSFVRCRICPVEGTSQKEMQKAEPPPSDYNSV